MNDGVRWEMLGKMPNIAERVMAGFERGMQHRAMLETRRALAALQDGPNPDAMRTLYTYNPQLAMQVEDQLYQREQRKLEAEARSAMSALLLGRGGTMPQPPVGLPSAQAPDTPGNALSAPRDRRQPIYERPKLAGPRPTPGAPAVDPLAPLPDAAIRPAPESGSHENMTPDQRREWDQYIGNVAKWADTPQKWDQAVDYFVQQGFPNAAEYRGLFSPQARQVLMQRGGIGDDERRLISADPEGYLTFQGKRLDVDAKQLKNLIDLNNSAMQILGSVQDQASYEAAKQQALHLYSSFGHDASELINGLPPQYSPETVKMLQLRGMDTSKQLAAIARENNIESQIEVREGRLDEYKRRGRAMEANQRRGQDIRSRDTRRGQDVTDKRLRETGGRKGGGAKRGDLIGPVYQKGGKRIQYSKSVGGYVDVATGQRVN